MRLAPLLCLIVGVAALIPNRDASFESYSGWPIVGAAYTLKIKTTAALAAENFTILCDDNALVPASPVSANTDFTVTFNKYTGDIDLGTLCVAQLASGAIAATTTLSVVSARVNASHVGTAKVGQPVSVTLALLDSAGNVIPNPNEYLYEIIKGPFVVSPSEITVPLVQGMLQFNNTLSVITFTFLSPGVFKLFGSTFTILPASGVAPLYFLTLDVDRSYCVANEACEIGVNSYYFANGSAATEYTTTVSVSSPNGGSQVQIGTSSFAWTAGGSVTISGLMFKNFTGWWTPTYYLMVTDTNNPDIYVTNLITVSHNHASISVPSDVGSGDPFTLTYTLYVDSGNTVLDGSRYPTGTPTISLGALQVKSPLLYSGDVYFTVTSANGQASAQMTIVQPGIYSFNDGTAVSNKIRVHPKSANGTLLPVPYYTYQMSANQFFIETVRENAIPIWPISGYDGSLLTLNGTTLMYSNDPAYHRFIQSGLTQTIYINDAFTIYTGGGDELLFNLYPDPTSGAENTTFECYTYPYLNFSSVPLRAQQGENVTVTVFASYPNGTAMTIAVDRVSIQAKAVYGSFVSGEVDVCKTMVNGQVNFTFSTCGADFVQLTASNCEFTAFPDMDPKSDVIVISNPPLTSKLGLATLPPSPACATTPPPSTAPPLAASTTVNAVSTATAASTSAAASASTTASASLSALTSTLVTTAAAAASSASTVLSPAVLLMCAMSVFLLATAVLHA